VIADAIATDETEREIYGGGRRDELPEFVVDASGPCDSRNLRSRYPAGVAAGVGGAVDLLMGAGVRRSEVETSGAWSAARLVLFE